MNSVIFEDIARIQAEKKQKRKEMDWLFSECNHRSVRNA